MSIESILIVEPDPKIKNLLTEVITDFGFEFEAVSDGLQAIAAIKAQTFDIVISDVNLPNYSGLDLIPKLQQEEPDATVVIITGFGHDYSFQKIIGAGAQDFIKKPFSKEQLSNKLSRVFFEREMFLENKKLQLEQKALNNRLRALISVATDLTAELDFDVLFPMIIGKVNDAMNTERASLYIIDWDEKEIWTKVAQQIQQIRLPLGKGISGRVAETGEMINVKDAWELDYYDREYDRKNRFRTRSVLCMPIRNHTGERIGVLQVINKKDKAYFDADDEIFFKGLSSQVGISLENSFLHEEVRLSFDSSIKTLSATVDAKHPLTAGHSNRVTAYSLRIAAEMKMDKKQVEVLKYAALLHDIGKIGIEDSILLKNGPFTTAERAQMNLHTVKTNEILNNFHFPKALEGVPMIATHHHEKVDGTGYPDKLTGEDIGLGSKILAVADVFDALTSPRDYPKYVGDEKLSMEPMPLKLAVSLLKKDAGTHFDGKVVEAFLQCLPQILIDYRHEHFSPNYVDEMISKLDPEQTRFS